MPTNNPIKYLILSLMALYVSRPCKSKYLVPS